MKRLLLLLAALMLPVEASAQFPSQNITLPAFVLPASAVNGGGTVTSAQLLAPDGTAAAPSYSFTSDPDNGMYYANSTTAKVRFSVDGSFVFGVNAEGVTLGGDVFGAREAANHYFQRNTTNAQRASWANTYASTISYEAFSIDWQTVANTAIVGTRTAATGTNRKVLFGAQESSGADSYTFAVFRSPTNTTMFELGAYTNALAAVSNTTAGDKFILGKYTSTVASGTVQSVVFAPTYNQSAATTANTDVVINRTQTAVGSGAQLFLDAQIATVSQFALSSAGKVTTYNTVATAGQGVDVIRAQATTGTVTNSGTASIAAWTPGAADVEVEVSCRVNITTSSNHTFSCDVTYTDVSNAARTRVLPMYPITGTVLTSGLMTNAIGTGDYGTATIRIGVKASTAIVVRTSSGGTFTGVVYTASGTIKQVG